MSCSNFINPTEVGEGSVMDARRQRVKRKARVDASEPTVEIKKRKAGGDSEAPVKKLTYKDFFMRLPSSGESSVEVTESEHFNDLSPF